MPQSMKLPSSSVGSRPLMSPSGPPIGLDGPGVESSTARVVDLPSLAKSVANAARHRLKKSAQQSRDRKYFMATPYELT